MEKTTSKGFATSEQCRRRQRVANDGHYLIVCRYASLGLGFIGA